MKETRSMSAVSYQRLEVLLLRVAGSVELLAFVAVFLPRSWMEAGHRWLGLGALPAGAVVDFIIRQASFTYGLHGVLLWILSLDVVRFRPLVVFTGISYVLAGPVFFAIDFSSGMPWFWTAGDGGSCLGFGVALLWLDCRRQRERTDDRSEKENRGIPP